MEKVIVKLCCGTMCYVMGGAELQLLDEQLPEELTARVDIRAVTCLDLCHKGPEAGKAPFAMVGDTIISSANKDKIIEEIRVQCAQ